MNSGKYNRLIDIIEITQTTDKDGFKINEENVILTVKAEVKTTKGYTLIANNSDFEEATTNFTIRYPKTKITRNMLINFKDKTYTIVYLNNVNEESKELEIQAKEVTH